MAQEFISDLIKPEFPKLSNSERTFRTRIEYVGKYDLLNNNAPSVNAVWGNYAGLVTTAELKPLPGTDYGELIVVCEYTYDNPNGGTGEARETIYEVEWVMFQRSLYEHPFFALSGGGTYELDSDDITDVEKWQNEQDADLKKAWKYQGASAEETLSDNAKMFARGIQLGQEYYEDFVPVVRVTTVYAGGNPGDSEAGEKDNPPSFAGGPAGYEWRKSADRAIRTGGQTRWERVEEWIGAEKVLTDRDSVYWVAPS